MDSREALHPALRVALAWQPVDTRPAWEAVFAFDAHLARIVSQAREGVLAQIRLAWWRDRLNEPPAARPAANPLLVSIAERLPAAEPAMIALVNGWEELLGEAPLPTRAIAAFAGGRAAPFDAAARMAGIDDATAERVSRTARRWALADFAFRTREDREHESALAQAEEILPAGPLPRSLRGIGVLGALADRAIARREPVLAGRIAPLVALRVGLSGR